MDWIKRAWSLMARTFSKSSEDRVSRLASSLAYYTVFCIAPLLVIAVRVGAAFFGKHAAQKQLSAQLSGLIGKQAAEAVLSLVTKAYAHDSGGLLATAISVVLFGYAAIYLFDELQDSMDTIWNVAPGPKSSWWRTLRDQLMSLAIVLAIVSLFLSSLVISTVMPAVNHFLSGGGTTIGGSVALAATLIVFTLVFATGYKFLPDADVAWRDVWIAAVIAAVLFTLGKRLLSAYLVRSGGASIYGATGSVAVILVWVYYSARVFFFGAEFTRVYSCRKERQRPLAVPRSDKGELRKAQN